MPFSEKSDLKDERKPLLRESIWKYGHDRGRGDDESGTGILDEIFAFENTRNQRFQWMLFITVTFMSILILMATLGVLLKLSETHHVLAPSSSSSTFSPISKLQSTNAPLMANEGIQVSTSTATSGIFVYVNESLHS